MAAHFWRRAGAGLGPAERSAVRASGVSREAPQIAHKFRAPTAAHTKPEIARSFPEATNLAGVAAIACAAALAPAAALAATASPPCRPHPRTPYLASPASGRGLRSGPPPTPR